ncbi:MAG: sugar phosphate isomerase/epimerase [Bacteroidia bacterium]|nr:sugar phosphate isomerase/epimerase [Bacteroidia bacterium]MBT8274870.1 sugar phosphate isomerase/epimerase [Bacteroidia bacterium]NNF30646.1 sugar phosphate isomerase/epimerase [Flavobacteriaceae bacterium]NNK54909.1 sugar phosphate isomerase/epimerase [Flavobacteriaceae bacterium]NNM07910.1 sugar phosphate isomerase/epimerase [Flavobacteriaceae bacterium]
MNKSILFLLLFSVVLACKEKEPKDEVPESALETTSEKDMAYEPKLSLAQWSLHVRYEAQDANPFNFAKDAKELGFDTVEFVTQLYTKQIQELGFQAVIDSLKNENERHGVSCNLIMVDDEGDLADPDEAARNIAVENHKKWVDAAVELGGHSIRVNTFGSNDPEVWSRTVVDGLKKLSEYAATKNISVLCENHGWLSSDADKLMAAIAEVNMPNCGTLPDFGNWCVKRAKGERWGECVEEYPDYYKGIELMMPAAKAVSAKANRFDENGDETRIDYYKMLQIVKNAGYTGYIGIEFESEKINEPTGIRATRDLIIKAAKKAN